LVLFLFHSKTKIEDVLLVGNICGYIVQHAGFVHIKVPIKITFKTCRHRLLPD